MSYVDGFVNVIPTKNLKAYRRMATQAARVWMTYGAIDFKECVADDLAVPMGMPFTKLAKSKKGETILFSFIVFKSRAHRDRVNAQVMKDPVLAEFCTINDMPFDLKRMAYGGFKVLVQG